MVDMKVVVADYLKPYIPVLTVYEGLLMEPEMKACVANVDGSKPVIPSHDFPKKISDAGSAPDFAHQLLKWIVCAK